MNSRQYSKFFVVLISSLILLTLMANSAKAAAGDTTRLDGFRWYAGLGPRPGKKFISRPAGCDTFTCQCSHGRTDPVVEYLPGVGGL